MESFSGKNRVDFIVFIKWLRPEREFIVCGKLTKMKIDIENPPLPV